MQIMQHGPVTLSRRLPVHPFLRRFAASAIVAFGALAIFAGVFFAISNELFRFAAVAETKEDVLWGSAFAQMDFSYKLARAEALKPDILVLGSSRSNQFRAEMMPGSRFYNASAGGQSAEEARQFLSKLYEVHAPKLVVMTIDPWWFRARPEGVRRAVSAEDPSEFSYRKMIANAAEQAVNPKFLKSLAFDPLERSIDPIGGRRPIGYRAARYAEGYRPDGSHQYGVQLLDLDPYFHLQGYGVRKDFEYFTAQLRQHRGRFSYTGPLSRRTSDVIRDVAALNKRHNVQSILVLPPMASKVYEVANTIADQRRYFSLVEQEMKRLGQELGVEVYNFHDLAALGVPDTQTIDGIHADEIGYLAVTSRMFRDGKVLAKYIDHQAFNRLEQAVRDPGNRPNFHLIAR